MKLTKRSSNINDEDVINEFLKNENKSVRRTKLTDLVCNMLSYISLIPSLVYNVFWFYYLTSALQQLGSEEPNPEKTIEGCTELYNWVNYSLTWTIIAFFKAILMLICVKCCCGDENECNLCCLIVKSVSSVIPSIIFVLKMPDYINNYKILNSNLIDITNLPNFSSGENMKTVCDNLANTLNLYYRGEYSYVIFVLFIFCFFPLGAICVGVKEYWKSRGYSKED